MIIKFENFLNEELFDSIPYKIIDKGKYGPIYKYEFITDKGYKYEANLIINNRILNIGFSPWDDNGKPLTKNFGLLGNFESNKIFATLKILLDKHKNEFDSIRTHSEPNRIRIYKELFKRMGYEIIDLKSTDIIAKKLNENIEENVMLPIITKDTYLFELGFNIEAYTILSKIPEIDCLRGEKSPITDINLTDKNDIISYMDSKYNKGNMKIGKFLRMFYPADIKTATIKSRISHTASDKFIERVVNNFKGHYDQFKNPRNFELVKGSKIRKWYLSWNYNKTSVGTLNNSCMRFLYKQYKFRIYTENPDKVNLLIMKDENNKLMGRALIWYPDDPKGMVYMDRVYYINHSVENQFYNYARKNGWIIYDHWKPTPKMIIQLDKDYGKPIFNPYMDTFRYFYKDMKILSSVSGLRICDYVTYDNV